MGVPCWVNDALNSSLMIWLDSNFARVFLNQDVEVSSPQPQPIDDIAGMRAAPRDDSQPRAVPVVSRHRALDLMPLLCRNRQKRRCNPPFSELTTQVVSRQWGMHERQSHGAQMVITTPLVIFFELNVARTHLTLSLVVHPSLRPVELCRFERSGTLRATSSRTTHHCSTPEKIGFDPNALELTPIACL